MRCHVMGYLIWVYIVCHCINLWLSHQVRIGLLIHISYNNLKKDINEVLKMLFTHIKGYSRPSVKSV